MEWEEEGDGYGKHHARKVGGGGRDDIHFHSIQLLFLRNNLIDVWSEEWVGSRELCAESALD